MVSAPLRALVSWIAARRVQAPVLVAHFPSPGLLSTASSVLSTVNVAADARPHSTTPPITPARNQVRRICPTSPSPPNGVGRAGGLSHEQRCDSARRGGTNAGEKPHRSRRSP